MHQINSSNTGVLKMATEASFVQENGKIIILSLPFCPRGVGFSRHSHSLVAADAPKCLAPASWRQKENIRGGKERRKPPQHVKPKSARNAERWSCKHTAKRRGCTGGNEREPSLSAFCGKRTGYSQQFLVTTGSGWASHSFFRKFITFLKNCLRTDCDF